MILILSQGANSKRQGFSCCVEQGLQREYVIECELWRCKNANYAQTILCFSNRVASRFHTHLRSNRTRCNTSHDCMAQTACNQRWLRTAARSSQVHVGQPQWQAFVTRRAQRSQHTAQINGAASSGAAYSDSSAIGERLFPSFPMVLTTGVNISL